LEPEIFASLGKHEIGAGGEIQLTDAMIDLAKTRPFHAVRFDGRTYDTGSKLGFLVANIAFGLARPDVAGGLRAELKKLLD
jgi:UTP--glucose-1-phosphate uridylyltransferase